MAKLAALMLVVFMTHLMTSPCEGADDVNAATETELANLASQLNQLKAVVDAQANSINAINGVSCVEVEKVALLGAPLPKQIRSYQ
jgi:predicted neutral ceramidase superfamily lipid hydrolase